MAQTQTKSSLKAKICLATPPPIPPQKGFAASPKSFHRGEKNLHITCNLKDAYMHMISKTICSMQSMRVEPLTDTRTTLYLSLSTLVRHCGEIH